MATPQKDTGVRIDWWGVLLVLFAALKIIGAIGLALSQH